MKALTHNDDGTVTLWLDGEPVVLSQPRLGADRALRDAMRTVVELQQRITDLIDAETGEPKDGHSLDDLTPVLAEREQAVLGFWRDTLLTPNGVPTPDDPPAFMVNASAFINAASRLLTPGSGAVELNDDGTVTLNFGDAAYTLDQPRLSQIKVLTANTGRLQRLGDESAARRKKAGAANPKTDDDLDAQASAIIRNTWEQVLCRLATPELTVDTLPAWAENPTVLSNVMGHLRSDPTTFGASVTG